MSYIVMQSMRRSRVRKEADELMQLQIARARGGNKVAQDELRRIYEDIHARAKFQREYPSLYHEFEHVIAPLCKMPAPTQDESGAESLPASASPTPSTPPHPAIAPARLRAPRPPA